MFWTITGIVLLAVLVGAWLFDRRFGMDMTHRDLEQFNRAQADRDVTGFNASGGTGL